MHLVDRVHAVVIQRTQSHKERLRIITTARIPGLDPTIRMSTTSISDVIKVEHTLYSVIAFE